MPTPHTWGNSVEHHYRTGEKVQIQRVFQNKQCTLRKGTEMILKKEKMYIRSIKK